MNEKAKAFIEEAKADPDLRERLPKLSLKDFIAEARKKGFELTAEDLEPPAIAVGEAELTNVVGAGGCFCPTAGGGGGTEEENDHTYGCACTTYGQGGDGHMTDVHCVCICLGTGYDNQRW